MTMEKKFRKKYQNKYSEDKDKPSVVKEKNNNNNINILKGFYSKRKNPLYPSSSFSFLPSHNERVIYYYKLNPPPLPPPPPPPVPLSISHP